MERVDVCIFQKKKNADELLNQIKEQTVQPAHIYVFDYQEDIAPAMNAAIQKVDAPLTLFLDADAVITDTKLIEKMTALFADQKIGLVEVAALPSGKSGAVVRGLQKGWQSKEAKCYTSSDLQAKGIECILFDATHTMFRTEALKKLICMNDCLVRPGMLIAADLLFSGYTLMHTPTVSVTLDLETNNASFLRYAYCLGVAQRHYLQQTCLGPIMTEPRKNISLDGKKSKIPPIIKNNMDLIYRENLKQSKGALGSAFFPAWIITLLARLYNAMGQYYHRLPLGLARTLSGKPSFF